MFSYTRRASSLVILGEEESEAWAADPIPHGEAWGLAADAARSELLGGDQDNLVMRSHVMIDWWYVTTQISGSYI